jgi:16S rRNA (guanine527-N7)-methyltransferase
MKVVNDVIKEIGLTNCTTQCSRVEKIDLKFDFVISRAVTSIPQLIAWIRNKILVRNFNTLHNGLFCLKGGGLEEEMAGIENKYRIFNINAFFTEDFFGTKKIAYVDLTGNNQR